jgi:transposase-like protein
MKNKQYLWHCPRTGRCGAIIIKTKRPFLNEGKYFCKRCNTEFTDEELLKHNKKNIQNYLNEL